MSRAKHAVSDVEGTQGRQEQKIEARNPKFETISNDQNAERVRVSSVKGPG